MAYFCERHSTTGWQAEIFFLFSASRSVVHITSAEISIYSRLAMYQSRKNNDDSSSRYPRQKEQSRKKECNRSFSFSLSLPSLLFLYELFAWRARADSSAQIEMYFWRGHCISKQGNSIEPIAKLESFLSSRTGVRQLMPLDDFLSATIRPHIDSDLSMIEFTRMPLTLLLVFHFKVITDLRCRFLCGQRLNFRLPNSSNKCDEQQQKQSKQQATQDERVIFT